MNNRSSDHFLVWLELGRVVKCCRKQKYTIRKLRLDRFVEDGLKESTVRL